MSTVQSGFAKFGKWRFAMQVTVSDGLENW